MPVGVGLRLVSENRELFETGIRKDPMSKREIAAFQERIGSIETVDDLTKDYEVFSFVMKAFDMEGEIYAKAMMRKILTSDLEDKSSLASRLSDDKYKEINKALGFDTDGKASLSFKDPDWVKGMVDLYVNQQVINSQKDENEGVGLALSFEKKVDGLTNWYKVIADKEMNSFFQTAFGLSEDFSKVNVDGRKKAFEKRMDIEDLKKPEVRERLLRHYTAFASVKQHMETPNPILTLMGFGDGAYNNVTIDIDMIQGFSGSKYLR
ncbi:DUF1217 domain-containing protein [Pontibaca salina]|uniref:DUF1217 domain-containing protein n=1 Tax=Pontibaca salina TaxID=2795731 RepID=A0A934LZH8_9RHOB|nr:DUF1217 domain-containing protein [Pontibaca salina]MBI6630927.1 DUF1217 domain-containing protein [Pontibaca salina]